jgi:hypothetical protein
LTRPRTGTSNSRRAPRDEGQSSGSTRAPNGDAGDAGLRILQENWPAERSTSFGEFLDRRKEWRPRFESDSPVYCLPENVIQALASRTPGDGDRHRSLRPLISQSEAETELDFLESCQKYSRTTVGVLCYRPVEYPLLAGPQPHGISEATTSTIHWDERLRAEMQHAYELIIKKTSHINHQRLGYAGRLTFDAQYRGDLEALETRWRRLGRPPFLPFLAGTTDRPAIPVRSIEQAGAKPLSVNDSDFYKDVNSFLRKWAIQELVTWDLPLPQGPLEVVSPDVVRNTVGPSATIGAHPSYYDMSSTEFMRDHISDLQRQSARDAGISIEHPVTDTSARGGRASLFENAIRTWLIEKTIRSRYGKPSGLIARITSVFCKMLEVDAGRIQQVRKVYSGLLER